MLLQGRDQPAGCRGGMPALPLVTEQRALSQTHGKQKEALNRKHSDQKTAERGRHSESASAEHEPLRTEMAGEDRRHA